MIILLLYTCVMPHTLKMQTKSTETVETIILNAQSEDKSYTTAAVVPTIIISRGRTKDAREISFSRIILNTAIGCII